MTSIISRISSFVFRDSVEDDNWLREETEFGAGENYKNFVLWHILNRWVAEFFGNQLKYVDRITFYRELMITAL